MELGPGSVLAGYRIERRVGSGGMGTVYLAQHPRLPRRDALKVLDARLAEDQTYQARFAREADLAARLQHPNIVQIYDRGVDGDRLWIAMQYVDGTDAAQLLWQGLSVLPPDRAVRIVHEAAKGLDHAHRQGLLHRDIKPANLLIAPGADGTDAVLVTDFGIARSMGETTGLTSAGSVLGTLAYAAPEQLAGDRLDVRTDVYALGGTLYELLTGFVPYPRQTPAALISAHLLDPPPRPSAGNPALPPGLDQVVAKAMAKDPADRYATCGELGAAALAAISGAEQGATVPFSREHRVGDGPAPRSRRWKVAAAIGALVAGVVAAVLALRPEPATGTDAAEVTIGAVPESPTAAAVLRPWLDDVLAGDLTTLTRNCWTQPPTEIPRMYGAADLIADAVRGPGVLGQFGPYWQHDRTRVSLRPSELHSSYGCPIVTDPAATELPGEFARYTVERYLSRAVGAPVNPADTETDYPLLCHGTGPGSALAGARRFDADALTVRGSAGSVVTVHAPVTGADGTESEYSFTLDHGRDGFCLTGIEQLR